MAKVVCGNIAPERVMDSSSLPVLDVQVLVTFSYDLKTTLIWKL